MRTDDFDYFLPTELIAQEPMPSRDSCRLLCLDRRSGNVEHRTFRDFPAMLKKGDRLVLNNTRVIPARLFGTKPSSGIAVEFLFTEKIDSTTWKTILKPARRFRVGSLVDIDGCDAAKLRIEKVLDSGDRIVKLVSDRNDISISDILDQYGHIPLPHYIARDDAEIDKDAYQTVFAKKEGAIAAPTAGLHFTSEMLEQIRTAGVDISYVTLHVGIGTFRPVKETDPRKHPMHEERYELTDETVGEIEETRQKGGRIIAVGTTVVRVLEHCAAQNDKLVGGNGTTQLLILPPYHFKVVDCLITNFHLPKSTLLMLVSAFASIESVLGAYKQAVNEKYRFFSYGDAMFLK